MGKAKVLSDYALNEAQQLELERCAATGGEDARYCVALSLYAENGAAGAVLRELAGRALKAVRDGA